MINKKQITTAKITTTIIKNNEYIHVRNASLASHFAQHNSQMKRLSLIYSMIMKKSTL